MEQLINEPAPGTGINSHYPTAGEQPEEETTLSTSQPFIQANTISSSLEQIRNNHIIPVYIRDNEPAISHHDFIASTWDLLQEIYTGETILRPNIRLSHPIKGRIPSAKDKPASELLSHEKTLYYERMAFIIEIPSLYDEIDGSRLSLTVGGVKSYSLDNLYSRKAAEEHFKVFIGFKNSVCTNLCVWTDGYLDDLKVRSLGELKTAIRLLLENYNINYHLFHLRQLADYTLSEKQFANLIGRCRMYNYLPPGIKANIRPMLFGENQLGMICREYFKDQPFCRDEQGGINLWRLYNLFTGANKSTYIDHFLDKEVNAFEIVESIRLALANKADSWFLN